MPADVHLNANADTVMKELNRAPKRSVHVLTPQNLRMNLIWKRGLYRCD